MRSLRRVLSSFGLTLGLALLLAPSVACLQVEAEAPSVTISQKDLTFEGVPAELSAAMSGTSMTKSFSQNHSKLDLPSQLTPQVDSLSLVLTAKSGITNFDFLRALRITMSGSASGSSSTPITLADYEKAGNAPTGSTLTIKALNPANVFEQWTSDTATFTVTVAGDLPTTSWSVDAAINFSGRIQYKY